MNLQPINPPVRTGQLVQCCACHCLTAFPLADMDGEPFRAFYCQDCAPKVDHDADVVILHPVKAFPDAWCEACGAGGYDESADLSFYAYGIGGGWAYACPSCALKSVSEGKARIL